MNKFSTADIGTKLKYFDYKDMPARQMSPTRLPEVYRPGKGWETISDTFGFLTYCIPIDEARLNEMIAFLGNQGVRTGP